MQGFTALDNAVLVLYIVLVVGMGSFFFRGQRNTEDYFLAGRRMPWVAVGVSIFATLFSAISLLGSPGWVYENDVTLGLTFLTIPLCTPIVLWVFLPFYHRLRVFTAYEYLERRFNPSVRLASSLLFLLLRGSYLAVVIYAPSLVLSTVTGLELKWTIFIVGGLATLYTLLGGMKAVIWTDVVQAAVLFGGLILVTIILVLRVEGGMGEIVAAASAGGPFRVQLGWGTWAEVTLWAVLINGFFIHLSMYGADQMTLQRYLTTPTLRAGRNSMLLNAIVVTPAAALLLFVGGALFVFYQQYPDRLADGLKGDAVLPHFVIHELPAGVSGVFIAAMFAAAMSTIDSAINSLSTSSMKDLYQRFLSPQAEERTYLNLSRLFTVFWGGTATFFALYIENFPNILAASKTLAGFFTGSMLGIFMLGALTTRTTPAGALIGAVAGFVAVTSAAQWTSMSFLWYAPLGSVVTLASGYLVSLCTARIPLPQLEGLTVRTQQKEA